MEDDLLLTEITLEEAHASRIEVERELVRSVATLEVVDELLAARHTSTTNNVRVRLCCVVLRRPCATFGQRDTSPPPSPDEALTPTKRIERLHAARLTMEIEQHTFDQEHPGLLPFPSFEDAVMAATTLVEQCPQRLDSLRQSRADLLRDAHVAHPLIPDECMHPYQPSGMHLRFVLVSSHDPGGVTRRCHPLPPP